MKKTIGVLAGLAVAVAAACTAGAWYTGQRLAVELENSIAQSNRQLEQALGANGRGKFELLSLERHLFSSTARYRLTVDELQVGEAPLSVRLTFVDTIEHGPLPWSRLKAFKLMPVMASSNAVLEKDEDSAAWFAASDGQVPLQARMSLGYDRNVQGTLQLLPLALHGEDGTSLTTSAVELNVAGQADGGPVEVNGTLGSLVLTAVAPEQAPVRVELQGLGMAANLSPSSFGFYVGQSDFKLAQSSFTFGNKQDVLLLKGLDLHSAYTLEGQALGVRQVYKVADIAFNGKPVGSSQFAWSLKQLDVPALQAIVTFYEQHLPAFQQAAVDGVPAGQALTAQEREAFNALMLNVLAGKPQFALEDFSFRTANGQSRLALNIDLARPVSLDQSFALVTQQLVARLKADLQVSKPMIGDLAALQASLQGLDAQQVEQASRTGEMAGQMALYSQLATVKDDNILMALSYADGQVELNGQQMTLEQFAQRVMGNLGAFSASAQ